MRDLTLVTGTSLDRNLRRSLAWSKSQREIAALVSESYPTAVVDKWREMRDSFDRDTSMPNPYKEVEDRTIFSIFLSSSIFSDQDLDLTIAKLQKELLKEAMHTSNGSPLSTTSSSLSSGIFFQKAIEVEDRM